VPAVSSSLVCALAPTDHVARSVTLIVTKHVRLRVIVVVVAVRMRRAYRGRWFAMKNSAEVLDLLVTALGGGGRGGLDACG